jgi:preprotein translocase subunit SecA
VLVSEKTAINQYTDSMIMEWTKQFRFHLDKTALKSVEDVAILELVAVISRASFLVNKYPMRDTQRLAVLVFIDSILSSMKGRLANISTGEGKSLITCATAISQLLIRDGQVDILTSSEVLAERDANESRALFAKFNIGVSCNCDAEANRSESVRRERYQHSSVIFGEIGHFQRDLLLTTYFDKSIRHGLAGCLIVDEVDSMCIDNICNTLYISHQIADLRYISDLFVHIWQKVNTPETCEYSMANVQKVYCCICLVCYTKQKKRS